MGTKSTVDSIFMGATMGSMAIPEAGIFIAGALAGAQALFDIFYPSDGASGPSFATSVDLQNAVTEIKQAIVDEAEKTKIDSQYSSVSSLNTGLSLRWKTVTSGVSSDDFNKDWASMSVLNQEMKLDGAPILALSSDLQEAIDFFKSHKDLQIKYIEVFLYAVNTYILVVKLNVLWEYRKALHSDDYPAYKKFAQKHMKTHDPVLVKNVKAWMAAGRKNPDGTPAPNPVDVAAGVQLEFDSEFVRLMRDYLGSAVKGHESGVISELDIFIKMVEKCYADYESRMTKREASIIVRHNGTQYEVWDSQFSKSIGFFPIEFLAKTNKKTYFAGLVANIHQEEILDKGVQDMDTTYRKKLKDILAHWEQAQAHAADFIINYQANINPTSAAGEQT